MGKRHAGGYCRRRGRCRSSPGHWRRHRDRGARRGLRHTAARSPRGPCHTGDDLQAAGHNRFGIDQHGTLQRRCEGMGHGIRMQTGYRRIQVVEGQLVHGLAQLGAHAAHRPAFIGHQQTPGLLHACSHCVHIQRLYGAQVYHLDRHTLRLQGLGRLQGQMHNLPGGGNRQVGAGTGNTRHAKRHQVVAGRNLATGGKQGLGFEHQHRVTGT